MSLPATTTDPMGAFREKLEQRVREDIANLLPDDAVNDLVKRAVEDVFFKPRKVNEGTGYSPNWVERPSWFVEAVSKEAAPILKATIAEFVKTHEAEIKQAVEQYLSPQNLTVLAVAAFAG